MSTDDNVDSLRARLAYAQRGLEEERQRAATWKRTAKAIRQRERANAAVAQRYVHRLSVESYEARARADEAEARLALERETRRAAGNAHYPAHYITMKAVAYEHGYALAVHGSQERDLDLVAVPWVYGASAPLDLVCALALAVDGVLVDEPPTVKPHGRLVWKIHVGGAAYVDMGVMDRRALLRALEAAQALETFYIGRAWAMYEDEASLWAAFAEARRAALEATP